MRSVLWFMALFGAAVASALFASNNHGTVTVFWPPYRVDVSINLFLLLLAACFIVLHFALRALSGLLSIPQQARRWRLLQKERAIQTALLDALSNFIGGRFVRARKAALSVIALEESVARGGEHLGYAQRLRVTAHLLAAESAHSVQDQAARDAHFQQALDQGAGRAVQEIRDGLLMRAARWALNDRDASAAVQWLDRLPQGAARRTIALRLRFKAARLAGQSRTALETARLLTKHRAFTEVAGRSIAKSLAIELIQSSHDQAQLQRAWASLELAEQHLPEVALEGAQRLLSLGGDAAIARQWLLPLWQAMGQGADGLATALRVRLVRVLASSFCAPGVEPDVVWLGLIEAAQMANPRDPVLQYLAGVVCMRISLWGKAQQMIKQSLALMQDPELKRDAWLALAALAEQRQDEQAANQAYREAAKRVVS